MHLGPRPNTLKHCPSAILLLCAIHLKLFGKVVGQNGLFFSRMYPFRYSKGELYLDIFF